ncbi:MAG: hypothetical protein ACYCSN_19090 [Acidobacteriaceae bacterium]
MQLMLRSDFVDYYDHQFDLTGRPFPRFSRGGMNRRQMFAFLKRVGLEVPIHGIVRELYERMEAYDQEYPESTMDLVVYLDETAHCGEGKIRLGIKEALAAHPDRFASMYFHPPMDRAQSTRYLAVGDRAFWLQYESLDDWRSNCGNVRIKVLGEEKTGRYPIPFALYAIDFVPIGQLNERLAVDFNVAPGIRGTGVEDLLSSREAVAAIKRMLSGG